jgi:hypothetical protein
MPRGKRARCGKFVTLPHFRHEMLSRYLEPWLNCGETTRSPVCVHLTIDFRPSGDYIEPMGIPATFWRLQGTTRVARRAIGGSGQQI